MRAFKIWTVIVILWACIVVPALIFRSAREDLPSRLHGEAWSLGRWTSGATNNEATVPAFVVRTSVDNIKVMAGMADVESERLVLALLASSAVIVVTAGYALFRLREVKKK